MGMDVGSKDLAVPLSERGSGGNVYDLGKIFPRKLTFPQLSTVLHRTGGVIHSFKLLESIFDINLCVKSDN
jgi:hypothetical protein